MAFPPKKQGPPQPGGGPPPPQGMPPGMPMGMPPGMPDPGAGADPMAAMLGQIGPGMLGGMAPPPPPSFPQGPGGLPFGGSMPPMDGDSDPGMDTAGSPLLQSLLGSMSQDPYGTAPGEPSHALDGGTGDPNMGLQELLQMLAMAKMGVGGGQETGVPPGGSGMPIGGGGGVGMMQGY